MFHLNPRNLTRHCTDDVAYIYRREWVIINRVTNYINFFAWGQRKKIYFQNVHFWLFENRLVKAALSQSAAFKTTTFLKRKLRISSVVPAFHFLWHHLQGTNWTWKLAKVLQKLRFYLCLQLAYYYFCLFCCVIVEFILSRLQSPQIFLILQHWFWLKQEPFVFTFNFKILFFLAQESVLCLFLYWFPVRTEHELTTWVTLSTFSLQNQYREDTSWCMFPVFVLG